MLLRAEYSGSGAALDHTAWQAYQEQLTSPTDYQFCQAVGTGLRELKLDVAEFRSARMHPFLERFSGSIEFDGQDRGECNVAILSPHAVVSDRPEAVFSVIAYEKREFIDYNVIGLEGETEITNFRFEADPLKVNGELPRPA